MQMGPYPLAAKLTEMFEQNYSVDDILKYIYDGVIKLAEEANPELIKTKVFSPKDNV